MLPVRPKKHLGQHFLHDRNIARKIASGLTGQVSNVLEIGPGTGILTQFLLENKNLNVKAIEIDRESVVYLGENFPGLQDNLIEDDFLKTDLQGLFYEQPFAVIGNFPYNISSQIFFRIIDHRDLIPEVVCMVQKEVAQRITAQPGSKTYGILSVLLQAWYDIEYLFTVNENVFNPPPKVKSAAMRMVRNKRNKLVCDEKLFMMVVKTAFNQRRKTLRNALSVLIKVNKPKEIPFADKRAEQLSVDDFIMLTASLF
ncbi:MAG: 16S rRNA (adenine(1518)-N(6)/adenine(1519)-N(6))-dimethyltransferase RsmA [Bacteroidales bacterium]